MQDDILRLEEKIAYQDHTISELNKVIIKQHEEIDLMKKELVLLNNKVRALTESHIKDLSEEEPPPHY